MCANRTDDPGLFTPCSSCACAQQLKETSYADPDVERLAVLIGEGLGQVEASHQLWPPAVVKPPPVPAEVRSVASPTAAAPGAVPTTAPPALTPIEEIR
ncbi:hypothetical protein GON03_19155 [Nocardioides sp. MAH-18]|uniref:Uncharacterized protein n=1 Tax=Nocardioides agri TaxID=2682843 RepID=A0A6L6Y166_9ACTN|nr:hypothetical protein [Nocardioides sp. MAH-18]MVQ51305.1 hypothetical protein [Nocardioides sp. MAH-18]